LVTKHTSGEKKLCSLKVKEALSYDIGKGIARVPLGYMDELNLVMGDVIEITGQKKSVAKVLPLVCTPDQEGNIIQIDGMIRENLRVGLGDMVTIKKVPFKEAKTILLSTLDIDLLLGRTPDKDIIREALINIPTMIDNRVKVFLFGQLISFYVKGTTPDGAVIARPGTEIVLSTDDEIKERGFKVYFEDVGGLGTELDKIREITELPFKYPRIFSKLGLKAPNGILLYGPPGTGKTLIAKAIATETSSYFIHLNGSEIMDKFYGESEARLRSIFEDAKLHAPSIIFLDEIDALAPKREQVVGDVEKRVTTQLLALMDGLVERGDVLIIAATNLPDVLDPALRRPGRLDREIMIPVPNVYSRKEILDIHTRNMPLGKDVDLNRIAEMSHGFVGADLASLAREAGMYALRRIIEESSIDSSQKKIEITMDDFLKSFKDVEPSALREYAMESSNIKMADIGGYKKIKDDLISLVELPLKYPTIYKNLGLESSKGILFEGPSGTGKTLMAKALAHETGLKFISISGPSLFSKWLGETEKILRQIFKTAKQSAPCILFFDELDGIAPKRGKTEENGSMSQRVVSQLVIELDSLERHKSVIVLGATNRPDLLEPSLLSPGRFEFVFHFHLPDEEERMEIFKVHTRERNLSEDVHLDYLVKQTEGFTGADIYSICRKAVILAIRDIIGKEKTHLPEKEIADFQLVKKYFDIALDEIKKQKC
jgi:transitional endoplasmic reticulum ATPase